jgi:hypothetical protein
MGGAFSGWRYSKATTVEQCRRLDANELARTGALKAGACSSGSCTWGSNAIGYEANTIDPADAWLRLFYTFTNSGESVDYRVGLETTRPHFGGLRWWFRCPLSVNGLPCGRRVGKLYLPPCGHYYGCRHCHRLTYTSCQQHDKRVDVLRRNPEALAALANNLEGASIGQLGLLLKALG